ncbi:MAG: hypothetical protein ABFR95_06505 [Actinomycetota bacterium]
MRRSTLVLLAVAAAVVVTALVLRATDSEDPPAATTSTTLTTVAASTTTTVSPSTTTTLAAGVSVCDLYGEISIQGTITSDDLVEASGLAVSRMNPGVFWSHNDSRGSATLYAFTEAGDDLGAYEVPGAFALDWEDMSAGPGPDGDAGYLYVGDIGDNFDIRRGLLTVYRVPDSDPASLPGAFPESTALTYRFPDAGHNAEALFTDPIGRAIYIVTKNRDATDIFVGSLQPASGPIDLEHVATLFLDAEVSAADMTQDGTTLALRGYSTVWMWHRSTEQSIAEMLMSEPCNAPSPDERQGEAIAFGADSSYWTISEGTHADIHHVERLSADS